MCGTQSKSCFKIHVDLEHFSPHNYLFAAKPQDKNFGKNICMKITSLLFTHYSKRNILNSNLSVRHELDVLETTVQGITEPGLPNHDHMLAQPLPENLTGNSLTVKRAWIERRQQMKP